MILGFSVLVAPGLSGVTDGQAMPVDVASIDCDEIDPVGPPVPGDGVEPDPVFEAYTPQLAERVVDTRNDIGGVDEALGAGCTLRIDTTGFVPVGTQGVALSVTVVSPVSGFFTAFPCDRGRPGTSSVNARPGLATANLVAVAPDAADEVCIFSNAGGHVIVDVSGWWTPGSMPFSAIEPTRAADTRRSEVPIKIPAGAITAVDVIESIVPPDAVAVAVNLAAVAPETEGFLVVYPCGIAPPLASNVNFAAGEQRAVSAIVEVGALGEAEGKICVTGNAETHFVLDVTGFYAPTSPRFGPAVDLAPVADVRVVDTRDGARAGVRFAGDDQQRFDLTTELERPDTTTAVVLNVIAARADTPGFLTIHPCSSPRPTTSSLNYDRGQTANLVVTSLSAKVEFCVYASTATDVVIDLVGAFRGTADTLATQISIVGDEDVDDDPGDGLQVDQRFVPGGADYTMRCGDAPVDLDLRVDGGPGVEVTVNGEALDGLDVVVAGGADELITLEFQRGARTETHHFRCVPSDFPFLRVGGTGGNTPGWYVTELGWVNPDTGLFLAILDERGVPVWYRRTDRKLIDVKLLSSGDLVASPITGRGFGVDPTRGHRVFDLGGDLLAERLPVDPTTYPADHHDYVDIAPAGGAAGRAVLSYPIVTGLDLSSLSPIDPATGEATDPRCGLDVQPLDRTVAGGVIQEIPAAPGLDIWIWDGLDHFSLQEVTYAQCFGNFPDDVGGEVDLLHFNSLQRIVEPGCEPLCDYLVAARHLDAVFRVDRSTDAIEWILASAVTDPADPAYVAPLSGAPRLRILGDPLGGPRRMHDARIDGDLVTMHDNRTATGEASRVVTYRIDLDDPAGPSATLVREIVHPEGRTSQQVGSAQVTSDGSVLVDWGATQPIFVEYGQDDTELFRIELPSRDQAYRITKYGIERFDADELRATAGGAIEPPL